MSVVKRLTATTAGMPKSFDVLDLLFEVGAARGEGLEVLVAEALVERLAGRDLEPAGVGLQGADGRDEDDARPGRGRMTRHLMLKNFSTPMSAPKPLSVTM